MITIPTPANILIIRNKIHKYDPVALAYLINELIFIMIHGDINSSDEIINNITHNYSSTLGFTVNQDFIYELLLFANEIIKYCEHIELNMVNNEIMLTEIHESITNVIIKRSV